MKRILYFELKSGYGMIGVIIYKANYKLNLFKKLLCEFEHRTKYMIKITENGIYNLLSLNREHNTFNSSVPSSNKKKIFFGFFCQLEFKFTLIIFGLEQKISKLHHSKYGLNNLANMCFFLLLLYVYI